MFLFTFLRRRRPGVSAGEPFRFPLPSAQKIALIDDRLGCEGNVRRFDPENVAGMAEFAPDAVGMPLQLALTLADQTLRGLFSLPSLTLAMVVITSIEDSPLADHQRDLLWRAFRVPVFEQLRGADGSIVARECEVHHGLHVCHTSALELGNPVSYDQCDCGNDAPRLMQREHVLRAAAASA